MYHSNTHPESLSSPIPMSASRRQVANVMPELAPVTRIIDGPFCRHGAKRYGAFYQTSRLGRQELCVLPNDSLRARKARL